MSELESSIEVKVVAFAEALGWKVRKVRFIGQNGCPDRWFFRKGKLKIIEFKRGGKPLRPDQQYQIKELREAGMDVRLVSDVESGIRAFQD